MNISKRILSALLILSVCIFSFSGCLNSQSPNDTEITTSNNEINSVTIVNGGRLTLEVGSVLQLDTDIPNEHLSEAKWTASNDSVTVSDSGTVTAISVGTVAVTVKWRQLSDTALVEVIEKSLSLDDVEKTEFYEDYSLASSYEEAIERSKLGLMSGSIEVPDQAPILSEYQPRINGLLVRNDDPYYVDENTYVIVDAYGKEVMRIYRGGGYITLEEVAAYVYAFGDVPANYVSGKNMEPESSIWGEFLRLNHSKFSGNTSKYPYEPELPNISGCGGDLYYYEIDIGTTGTDSDPAYATRIYNNGQSITRGAARIVYTRYDANRDEIIEPNEKFVFYTYNHYNDFQEYLNYYGGWGEMFGNVTGGGSLSSKTDYAPTPYVPVVMASLTDDSLHSGIAIYAWVDKRAFDLALAA